jgi:hypothetical protein
VRPAAILAAVSDVAGRTAKIAISRTALESGATPPAARSTTAGNRDALIPIFLPSNDRGRPTRNAEGARQRRERHKNGVSAVISFSTGLQVLANDIANVNTTGYKSSRADYEDSFANCSNHPTGKSRHAPNSFLSRPFRVFRGPSNPVFIVLPALCSRPG